MSETILKPEHFDAFTTKLHKAFTDLGFLSFVISIEDEKNDQVIYKLNVVRFTSPYGFLDRLDYNSNYVRNAVNSRKMKLQESNGFLKLTFPRVVVRIA